MNELTSAESAGLVEIAKLLGRREAFGLVAGRCSAAEAACMRELRSTKKYLELAPTWEEFCVTHLHMSRAAADRTIRLLDEFGPGYFELAQLVRIPPEAYRAIAPAVKDQAVHVNGEAIALIPENAERVASAVAELRSAAQPKPAAPVKLTDKERLAALDRRCSGLLAEFEDLVKAVRHRDELAAIVVRLQTRLDRFQLQL
jgi:hypothetical protein